MTQNATVTDNRREIVDEMVVTVLSNHGVTVSELLSSPRRGGAMMSAREELAFRLYQIGLPLTEVAPLIGLTSHVGVRAAIARYCIRTGAVLGDRPASLVPVPSDAAVADFVRDRAGPRRPSPTYPDDWTDIAGAVKRDAGHRCVRCKSPHNPAIGYCLTVHHFDGDTSHNGRWNLMALCQRCHLSVQNRARPAQGMLFKPSTWAMPYVAGYYEFIGEPLPDRHLWEWIREYRASGRTWPWWARVPDQSGA